MIEDMGKYTSEDVATGLQNLLICFEMLLAALAHVYAFPAEPFEGAGDSMKSNLLEGHFAHDAVIKDFNEVMPVLLPSSFRPGKVTSTTRLPVGRMEAELKEYDVESKGEATSAATVTIPKKPARRKSGKQRKQRKQTKDTDGAEQQGLLGRSSDDHDESDTFV